MNVEDSPIIQIAEQRRIKILNADYSKVDLVSFTNELKHLSIQEKTTLYDELIKYDQLFSGGLGQATGIKPVYLELKDDAKPCHIK